jgi:hypothetical protein
MLSAAEILGYAETLGSLRGQVLPIPDGSILCVHLGEDSSPAMRERLGCLLSNLATQWDIAPERIVVLERGVTLAALSDADLARAGLRRADDAGALPRPGGVVPHGVPARG